MATFDYDLIVFTSGPNAYAPKRLREECNKKGLKFTTIAYKEVNVSFKNNYFELDYNGVSIPTSKAVFLRGVGEDPVYNSMKYAILNWYNAHSATVLNFNSYNKWPSLDKTIQYIMLATKGLPIVESFTFGSKKRLTAWATDNYPFIAKDIIGSCGEGVFKIKDGEDLAKLFTNGYSGNVSIKKLIIQKFLTSGEDLRVIVIGGQVIGAMKRTAQKGSYLTNYSQGGMVEKYDIESDKDVEKIALSVSKLFNLDYCGVDLMKDNNGDWIVLEVNRACQFEGFEESTGINIAGKVLEYLVK